MASSRIGGSIRHALGVLIGASTLLVTLPAPVADAAVTTSPSSSAPRTTTSSAPRTTTSSAPRTTAPSSGKPAGPSAVTSGASSGTGSSGLSAAALRRLPGDIRSSTTKLRLIATFKAEAKRYGVPADLLMALAYTESGWRSSIVSADGAIGICQLLPDTARWLARDLIGLPGLSARDPEDNIRMGARLLRQLLRSFRTERLALAAYFDGHGTVVRTGVSVAAGRYAKIVDRRRTMFQGL